MKKILTLTLAIIMAISLVACGGTSNQNQDNGTPPASNQQTGGVDEYNSSVTNDSDSQNPQGFDAYLGEYRINISKYMGEYADYESYAKITKDGNGYSMEVNSINTGFEESLFPVGSYTGTLEVAENGDGNYKGTFTANGEAIEIFIGNTVVAKVFGGNKGSGFIKNNEPPQGKKWYSEMVGEFINSYPEPSEAEKAQAITIGGDGSITISYLNPNGEKEIGRGQLADIAGVNSEMKFDVTTDKGNTFVGYIYPNIRPQKIVGTENSYTSPDVWYDSFKLYLIDNAEDTLTPTLVNGNFVKK